MNRGGLQSSTMHQMVVGSSNNWWSINNMRPPFQQASSPPPLLVPSPPHEPYNILPPLTSPCDADDNNQQLPQSWSQLLLGGLVGDENHKSGLSNMRREEQILHQFPNRPLSIIGDLKAQISTPRCYDVFGQENGDFQSAGKPNWSSPTSSITSLNSNNLLDFSGNNSDGRRPLPDPSSECNSKANGGAQKKARVQSSSIQSPFKVRKEKLGDRVTALHQLVSPFGKTDTASVLLEAIGYIRFLQSQIEALSLPYLANKSGNMGQHQHQQHVQGDRNCLFPEDPGQECCEGPKKDLRSRGLCLVPISCTLQVGSDNAADYWAPAFGGSGFR